MKKNLRLFVITLIVSLSLLLSACNMQGTIKDKFITPMQQYNGIPTNCETIC